MATRSYQFIVGPETSTLPTIGTPSEGTDLISKDYNQKITGTRGVPQAITVAGVTAAMIEEVQYQVIYCIGDGGAVDISANPQIDAGEVAGQHLLLIGTSDSSYVKFEYGDGLVLNGTCTLKNNDMLSLFWDGTNWLEMFRNNY